MASRWWQLSSNVKLAENKLLTFISFFYVLKLELEEKDQKLPSRKENTGNLKELFCLAWSPC